MDLLNLNHNLANLKGDMYGRNIRRFFKGAALYCINLPDQASQLIKLFAFKEFMITCALFQFGQLEEPLRLYSIRFRYNPHIKDKDSLREFLEFNKFASF